MKIAVIGAGITGLTFAATLKKYQTNNEIDFDVYERDSSSKSRFQGYAIGLNQIYGLKVLKELGLYDELANDPASKHISNFIMQDNKERILFSSKGKEQDLSLRVQRDEIKNILRKTINEDSLHYDYHLVDIKKEKQGYTLFFNNKETKHADFIVLCDGANSKIRTKLTGNNNSNYTGLIGISALSNLAYQPDYLKGGYYMGLGNSGCSVFIYNQPNGIYYGFTLNVKQSSKFDGYSNEQLLALLNKKISGWSGMVPELINNTNLSTVKLRKYYEGKPLEKIHYDDLIMIGDTAHYMTPFQGLGGNLALIDGYELAQAFCLKNKSNDNLKMELQALETKILKRGNDALALSSLRAKQFHRKNIFFSFARRYQFWKLRKSTSNSSTQA